MKWPDDDFTGPCDGVDDNFLMSNLEKPFYVRWIGKMALWYAFGALICARKNPVDVQKFVESEQDVQLRLCVSRKKRILGKNRLSGERARE